VIIICFPQGGIYLLHLVDQAAIGWAILIIGVFECIALAWVYGFEKMASDIEVMIAFRPSFWWSMMWKFVTPGLILVSECLRGGQHLCCS
jgi:SNF family Na+-dependent transporter